MIRLLGLLPKPLVKRLIHLASLLRNAHTLGVRLLVQDEDGRVLLVRHSYLPGWYLPGGGVDVGETVAEAAKRELLEETGLRALAEPHCLGLFHNNRASRRDHVVFFRIAKWAVIDADRVPNSEILEMQFFAADALPDDVTPSTRQRLLEQFEALPTTATW